MNSAGRRNLSIGKTRQVERGVYRKLGSIVLIFTNLPLVLDLAAMAFCVEPTELRGPRWPRRATWRLLVEGGLDQASQSLAGHFPVSLTTAMTIRVNDQDAIL